MTEEHILCPGCERYLVQTEFHRDKRSPTGYARRCKRCRNGTRASRKVVTIPKVSEKELIILEARRRAIWILVRKHRMEFDTLVRREKLAVEAERQRTPNANRVSHSQG